MVLPAPTLDAVAATCRAGDRIHFDLDMGALSGPGTPDSVVGTFVSYDPGFGAWRLHWEAEDRTVVVLNDWVKSVSFGLQRI